MYTYAGEHIWRKKLWCEEIVLWTLSVDYQHYLSMNCVCEEICEETVMWTNCDELCVLTTNITFQWIM